MANSIVFRYEMKSAEEVVPRCSVEKALLEISQNSQENTCVSLFFSKIAGLRPATLGLQLY